MTSQLRYLSRPREIVLLHKLPASVENIENQIRAVLEEVRLFLRDHKYSLFDTYGDEFGDLIADIPDPTLGPLAIIDDFLGILSELGVWSADRAALILMIKIDKLKTREKYERHFLLLSLLFTTMIKIRKMCDDAYEDLTEREKLEKFSRPKLLRLVEMLEVYTPEQVVSDVASTSDTADEAVKSKLAVDEANADNKDTPEKEILTKEQEPDPKTSTNNNQRNGRKGGGRRPGPIQEDPDALCGLIVVDTTFTAKILYHFLKDLSRCRPDMWCGPCLPYLPD